MTKKEDDQEYFKLLYQIQDMIVDILYEYKDTSVDEYKLKSLIKNKLKLEEPLFDKIFYHAIVMIVTKEYINRNVDTFPSERYKDPDTGEEIETESEDIISYSIAAKGITKILEKELKGKRERLGRHERILFDLGRQMAVQSVQVKEEKQAIDTMKLEINEKFTKIERIENEIENIKSDFYTKILEIFGIFVAIFSFIIIGFSDIPRLVDPAKDFWYNFYNVSAVFFPLTIVLIILLAIIGFINWWTIKR